MPKKKPFKIDCDDVVSLSLLEEEMNESVQQMMICYFQKVFNDKTIDFQSSTIQNSLLCAFNGNFLRLGLLDEKQTNFNLAECKAFLLEWRDTTITDPSDAFATQLKQWVRFGFFKCADDERKKITDCLYDWYLQLYYYGFGTLCILDAVESVIAAYYQHHTGKDVTDSRHLMMILFLGIQDNYADPNQHIIQEMSSFSRTLRSSGKSLRSEDGIPGFDWYNIYNTKLITQVIADSDLNSAQRRQLYTLITTLIYQMQRHLPSHRKCIKTRTKIDKLAPVLEDRTINDLKQFITTKEEQSGTYYGDNLSDDSDSGEEIKFKRKSRAERRQVNTTANTLIQRARPTSLFVGGNTDNGLRVNRPAPSSIFKIPTRQAIPYQAGDVTNAKRQQLEAIMTCPGFSIPL